MSKQLIGQVSQEQIDAWKKEHGKVFAYKIEGRIGYLRTVSRDVYSLAATKVSSSPAKFNETVINGIWLGGDEAIRKEDRYYFGLSDFVEELMNKKKGELGEL
ncbi:hypothetical protein [Chitinophaga sp. HK235]|uniref:hypothetical protein n=1 Tax=Chitinophaga sp. HK235 TaxID=2952571 RepID=UPI001BA52AEE|nr:hypothetical protein [Chitinophaga sp. HK235]